MIGGCPGRGNGDGALVALAVGIHLGELLPHLVRVDGFVAEVHHVLVVDNLTTFREDDLDGIIMWFGKYGGIRFKDIPVSYFRFLAENMAVKPGDRKEKIIEYYNRIKA